MKHIASCSFGKDSIATILLAIEHNEPLDGVVFSEVMFDHKRNISGENPMHIEWIYDTAIPKLESMGVNVDVVRSDKDYISIFNTPKTYKSKYVGKLTGFPIGGRCLINDRCKIKPIHKYYHQFNEPITQYLGIAIDEPKRLARLKNNQVSLLDKYGYTEKMAKEKCEKFGLLSPIYENGTRGGCWFCPNCKISNFIILRQTHTELWNELKILSQTPNLCSYGFRYGQTVQDIERRMNWEQRQLTLF